MDMDSKSQEIIGYSFGAWDLLHVGHIHQLEQAKKHCDWLIVGVFTDEVVESFKRKPIIPDGERAKIISALKCVDDTVMQHSRDPTENIDKFRPDILFHGDDWDEIPGAACMESIGGKVITPPYYEGQSTSRIIETIIKRHCEQA